MNRRLEQRRADHAQYKKDVKERGKPFYPFAMFHDTVMSLLVVCLIVALAVVWKFTRRTRAHGCRFGLARQALRREGRPRDDELHSAPRLVLLLPLLPAADLQVAGVGHPRHGHRADDRDGAPARAALPRRRRERRPLRRPVAMVAAVLTIISMGTLTYKGATAKESLGAEYARARAVLGGSSRDSRTTRKRWRRAEIFAQVGCMQCHTYLGAGTSNAGAPIFRTSARRPTAASTASRQYVADPPKFGNRRDAAVRRPRAGQPGQARRRSSRRPRARSERSSSGSQAPPGRPMPRALSTPWRRPTARSA